MNPKDRVSLKEFRRILTVAIRTCYQRQRFADVDSVFDEMKRTASHRLTKLAPDFGWLYMRIVTQQTLKRTVMDDGEDRGHGFWHRRRKTGISHQQPELNFPDIEQFRGIPPSISYEDPNRPGHIIYIPWEDSLRWQRKASLQLLDRSIEFDVNRRQAQATGTDFVDALADIYGELPVKELIRHWEANGKPSVAMSR